MSERLPDKQQVDQETRNRCVITLSVRLSVCLSVCLSVQWHLATVCPVLFWAHA